ncbi:tumor necrosis factor receptor superfamily member 5-like [Brachyhypopomus gauderio]|uniref:tumor necrosis factor receptor superfamily member 5-like n=1 Tax=Brachyhypopomus gauderio TaxID=698409 RepID=UPI00404191BD
MESDCVVVFYTQCTRTSDTVCKPLESHYCTEQVRGSCTQAEKHTACSPGHYIQQERWCNVHAVNSQSYCTALKDTVRDVCTAGTYSNGSLQTCQPHPKCEDFGLVEKKPGTCSTDAECGKQTSYSVIATILFGVGVVMVVVVAVFMVLKKTHKPVQHAGVCVPPVATRPPNRDTFK